MSSRATSVYLAAALVVATVLRLYALSAASFEPQEIAALAAAERLLGFDGVRAGSGKSAAASARPAPAAVVVSALALRSGQGELVQRLPGAMAGIATVVAAGVLGAQAFGAEAALYAVIGLGCSPVHVAASRIAGAEVWLALFATLSAIAFVRALCDGGPARRWLWFVAAAVLTCAGGYAGLFPLAGMGAYALAALRHRGGRATAWRAIAACGAAAAAGLALVASAGSRLEPSLFGLHIGVQLPADIAGMLATGRRQMAAGGMLLLLCAAIGVGRAPGKRGAGVCAAWLIAVVLGTVVTDAWLNLELHPEQLAAALPPYFVLLGAGMSWLRVAVGRVGMGRTDAVVRYGLLFLLLALEIPALWTYLRQPEAPWREAASLVDANARGDDTIVVLNDRQRFLFYAPDLQRRAAVVTRPGMAPVFFVHPARGWLIAPAASRMFPGWQRVEEWFLRFPPVNLSPGPGVDVFYVGRGGRGDLLRDAACFDLPTAVLVRGSLLLDLLKETGPILPVLWKVDQIALSREPLDFHNPQLLSVAAYLADRGFTDRALSLAYRLATADPDWAEARQAVHGLGRPSAQHD